MAGVNKKRKNNLIAVACIMVIGAMVLLTVYLPQVIMKITDQKTEKKMTGFKMEVKTYENGYSDFYEEIKAMSNQEDWEDGVEVVPITENGEQITDKELTASVNKQIKRIENRRIVVPDITMESRYLTSRQLVTLYSKNKTSKLNGIRFWVLTYENPIQTLEIVMEADYQFICQFQVTVDASIHEYTNRPSYLLGNNYPSKKGLTGVENWWTDALGYYYELKQKDTYAIAYRLDNVEYTANKAKGQGLTLAEAYGYYNTKVLMTYYNVEIDPHKKETLEFGIYYLYKLMHK